MASEQNTAAIDYCQLVATSEPSAQSGMLVVNRFWKQVTKTETCWIWAGHRNSEGYGFVRPDNTTRQIQAHRLAYALLRGVIPSGMCVCHHCDNPPCVRPDHLFLGTNKDNVRDAVQKGRMAIGEANANATLTLAEVLEIRERYAALPMSPGGKRKRNGAIEALIKDYSHVSRTTIYCVATGQTWKHLPFEVANG